MYRSLDQGIYVAKETLSKFGIEVPEKKGYHSFGLVSFLDFADKTPSACTFTNRCYPVIDSKNNNFLGCPPIHLWSHSSDSHLYFEKLNYSIDRAFVTYVETPDSLKILTQTITNLSEYNQVEKLAYTIFVYYRSDSAVSYTHLTLPTKA